MLTYLLCTSIKRGKEMHNFLKELTLLFLSMSLHFSQSPTSQTLGLTCFFPIHSHFQWVSKVIDTSSVLVLWKTALPYLLKLKHLHVLWPDNFTIKYIPKEMHTSVHQHTGTSMFITLCNSLNWKLPVPVNNRKSKWTVVSSHNRILQSNKNEHSTRTHNSMDESILVCWGKEARNVYHF